jgi:hypothetical protein
MALRFCLTVMALTFLVQDDNEATQAKVPNSWEGSVYNERANPRQM